MDQTIELLTEINENASIGKDVLGYMIKHCEDANLRQMLADQFAKYHEITDKAKKLLEASGGDPNKQFKLTRCPIFHSMKIHLKIDRTPSHMAEMLMHGFLMGIINASRTLHQCSDANEDAKLLARQLLTVEERNLNQMESWL